MLPAEILSMDERAIDLYIKILREGEAKVRNIRLMIVGHSGVGKTTLAKRLFKEEVHITNHQSTDGIDVHDERCKISLIDGTWLQSDGKYSKRLGNHVAPMLRNAILSDDPLKSGLTKTKSRKETTHLGTDMSLNLATNMSAHEISNENSFEEENDPQNDRFHRTKKHFQETIKGTNDGISYGDNCDLSLWDFAGQSIYYATHQAFLSRRGIYLLVFDISKQITDEVENDELCADVTLEQKRQISEFVLFWLNSIHEFCSCQGENGPPVIFVGTFADKLEKERKQNATKGFLDVRSILPKRVEKCHITEKDFDVDNAPGNKNEDKNIDELRRFIVKVAKEQVYWNERIPLRWIALEDRLLQLKEERNVIPMKELRDKNEELLFHIKEEELDLFLKFHHQSGTFLYFGDEDMKTDIVLRPQWLIDAFKSLITANIVYIPECKEEWLEFKSSAILTMDLITRIWKRQENSIFWVHKDLILRFMNKLGFVAKPKKCTDEVTEAKDIFLVPCMFKNKVPEKITTLEDTEQCKITSKLCLTNDAKPNMRYIPSTAFNKVLAACINQWELAKEDDKYMIFRGGAVLKLKDNHRLYIFLYEHVIQIWISRMNINGLNPNDELCLEVKDRIEKILKENVRMQREILSFVKCHRYTLYSNTNMDHPLQLRIGEDNIQCFCRKQEHVVSYICLASCWLPKDPDQEWPNVDAMTDQIKVAKCTPGHVNLVKCYLNSHEVYSMTKCIRGRCLILSNEKFHKNIPDRQGTETDVARTEELFKQLHFNVIIKRDLTAKEIKKTLELEARHSDHDQAECFVCVICSHGTEKGVCGTDGKTVSHEEIKTFFDADNCKDLQSKPKLFFIQACQGETKDRSDVADGGSDRGNFFSKMFRVFGKTDKTDTTDAKNKQKTVPAKTDILIAYATHPGYVSIRNIDYGSWFIQAVIYVFQKYAFTDDISSLLTRVNNLVANGRAKLEHGGLKNVMQASKSETSLRRKLFFFPGHVSNSDA